MESPHDPTAASVAPSAPHPYPQQQPPPPGYPQQQQPPPPGYPQQPPFAPPPPGYPQQQPPPPGYPQQQQPPPPSTVESPTVVQTDVGASDGHKKCPRCGATDITLNIATGQLRCGFCRHEGPSPNALTTYHLDGDPKLLVGVTIGSGGADIIPSTAEVLTFKCQGCGAEVVIDTRTSMQARCHWCRNVLSMNQQIPNGAVPDAILPFRLTKETAIEKISAFVGKRMFFAHPRFKAEFEPVNVMGVYLPYMVVDVNAKVALRGQGEHQTRTYTERDGDKDVRYYDADVYDVTREFDLYVDDLTVESSADRMDQSTRRNSNNVINSIMPFDVENSVVYDANFLAGFASEKRDTNVADLSPTVTTQAQDIARYHANSLISFYDRGVRWDAEHIDVVGQRWVSVYLPVWLYSYQQVKSGGQTFVHYVAVNGRTGETMGSVPIHQAKLLFVSALVEILGIIAAIIYFVVAG